MTGDDVEGGDRLTGMTRAALVACYVLALFAVSWAVTVWLR